MLKLEKTNVIDKEYWNIVKGIGIILVVIGHLCWDLTRYIYLFHLPLFFFVSGYLYNEDKYGDDPYLHVANRLKSSWMKYVLVFWVLIWTHNLWLDLKIAWVYPGYYDITDIAGEMVQALLGQGGESFGITLWFVPVSVISTCLLGFIVTFSRKVYTFTNSLLAKYGMQFIIVLGCTILGYYLEKKQVYLAAESQVSLVVMPFLWIAYLLRNVRLDIKPYLNIVGAILCGVLVYAASGEYKLDLAMKWVYPYMHIVAFMGIYMCLYLAKMIQKVSGLNKCIAAYGKASFWIMFAHLPLCRIFDWIYINLNFPERFEELYYVIDTVIFPDKFWPVYLLIGLGLTFFIYIGYEEIKDKLKKLVRA